MIQCRVQRSHTSTLWLFTLSEQRTQSERVADVSQLLAKCKQAAERISGDIKSRAIEADELEECATKRQFCFVLLHQSSSVRESMHDQLICTLADIAQFDASDDMPRFVVDRQQ